MSKRKLGIVIAIVGILMIAGASIFTIVDNRKNENNKKDPTGEVEKPDNPSDDQDDPMKNPDKDVVEQEPITPPDESGGTKTLIVYFSATNNTESVAKSISEITKGDVVELLPVNPYTSADLDWNNENSRVSKEHNDESLRKVELKNATIENFDDYNVIFIGYPIWWGTAAWPINTFIQNKNNNFDGKIIVPFCTSESSEIGESATALKNMAGAGKWLNGHCFSSGKASEDEVFKWLGDISPEIVMK